MKLLKIEKHNCTPCGMVENFLQDQQVDYDKVNIEDRPELAQEYGVMSVPVTILLNDVGDEVDRVVGFNPPALNGLIQQL